jgi:hypothetical protein
MPVATLVNVILASSRITLPHGSLRIGGDAPYGLVLAGSAPAARTVRVYDRETGVLVAETTSAGDGTYAFAGLSARTEGYDVQIMGNTGERDVIVPRVQPG